MGANAVSACSVYVFCMEYLEFDLGYSSRSLLLVYELRTDSMNHSLTYFCYHHSCLSIQLPVYLPDTSQVHLSIQTICDTRMMQWVHSRRLAGCMLHIRCRTLMGSEFYRVKRRVLISNGKRLKSKHQTTFVYYTHDVVTLMGIDFSRVKGRVSQAINELNFIKQ